MDIVIYKLSPDIEIRTRVTTSNNLGEAMDRANEALKNVGIEWRDDIEVDWLMDGEEELCAECTIPNSHDINTGDNVHYLLRNQSGGYKIGNSVGIVVGKTSSGKSAFVKWEDDVGVARKSAILISKLVLCVKEEQVE